MYVFITVTTDVVRLYEQLLQKQAHICNLEDPYVKYACKLLQSF